MYQPAAFVVDDPSVILDTLRRMAFGHLVTAVPGQGIEATALPFVVDDEVTTLLVHVARANSQWRSIDGAEALIIVPGIDAYVSPRWYPSKAVDGKVVPTWNYELIHIHGTVRVVDDAAGKLAIVEALTDQNETRSATFEPEADTWAVDDAPDDFIDRQLRAIVGLEVTVESVVAKSKLSQNRSEPDRRGVQRALSSLADPRSRAAAGLMTD